jgi:hypothetical protein
MRTATPRALVALVLVLFPGCASAQEEAPDAEPVSGEVAADEAEAPDEDGVCVRNATVTVHVRNQSSMDVQITFGNYRAGRAAEGFSRTTYNVPRVHLQRSVRLQILRGGLQLGAAPEIQTEAVFCNDATLVIGPRPRYSFFYGDKLSEPVPEREAEEDAEEASEGEAPADSTRSSAEGQRPSS